LDTYKSRTLKSDFILLLASLIWGFAFVAQRVGMEYIGPFLFNGVRFALGALWLLPFLVSMQKFAGIESQKKQEVKLPQIILSGGITGVVLFIGASLQQYGIVYTSAGKAGFITGLYVIIVPVFGWLWKKPAKKGAWLGAFFAILGLYLLSFSSLIGINIGDVLMLIGAFFWALHVHLIDNYVNKIGAIVLAFIQFFTCSILSLIAALFTEIIQLQSVLSASIPILYAGLISVGIAFTLQVIAQKEAHPSHTAIILSLEAVFAVLGGWLILNESLSLREIIGCGFMLLGMLSSQFNLQVKRLKNIFNST
jgi:drug/metabolite transporter (DMT)-like permease